MGKIFCLMGKSSSGKDTIFKEISNIKELKLNPIVLYTTRPKRTNETTYGTPVRIPGAVEISLEPKGDPAEFYADDVLYYSASNNPFMCYSYTIFEAEVASTFNENLMHHYLQEHAKSKEEEAFLISKNLDDIVATLFRQTMFAEFELRMHRKAEEGNAITLTDMRDEYRSLLEAYFGPVVRLEAESDLECLRIPHFYRAYYCYKYATGISASIALSEKVLRGGSAERDQYLSFLKSGGSLYPLDSLKLAGVDMACKTPVLNAISHFGELLDRLDSLCRELNLTDPHSIELH